MTLLVVCISYTFVVMLHSKDAIDAMHCARVDFINSASFLDHNTVILLDVSVITQTELDVFAALWAQDVVAFSEKATANQGHGALLTVEAVIVPLALLKGNILAASKTANRGGA